MHLRFIFLHSLFIFCLIPLSAHAVGQDLLIQFKTQTSKQLQHAMSQKAVVSKIQHYTMLGNIQHWTLTSPMDAKLVIQQLSNDPNVAFAEPNYPRYLRLTPNDLDFTQQWGLNNTGQFAGSLAGSDMRLPLAWNTQTGSKNVIVAIIDDAIDINHPDLQANIWTNTAEIAGNNIDDDNNGYIDDVHGWDFVDNDNDPSADVGNGEGHGTMVAGCIGAVGNNNIGITGVNWNVSMMPLKFGFDVASELAALNYAAANGADIVNASWGGPQFSFAESAGMQTLLDSGILLVAAAGNYDGNNDRVLDYPSGLPHANVLAVAAYQNNGQLTPWTHYGATTVDVAAPGLGIYTTTTPNTYDFVSGTSFSAPYTAGIAALILAQYPTLTYQEVKGRIMASVDTINQKSLNATDGSVNAAAALSMAAQPELVIADFKLSDNNNNQLDPNESINLDIQLENVWLAATGITASLSSSHALVSVSPALVNWANLNMGAKAFANTAFTLHIGNIVGFSNIPFTLTIQTNQGFTFTRHFNLDIGTLISDTIYQGQIMLHDQDEFQYYHIDVPPGSPFLNITTAANHDTDILLRYAAPSQFDFSLYSINPQFGRDPNTLVSVRANTGNEQILVHNPQAGTWFVTVISFDQQPSNYQILASITSSQPLVPLPSNNRSTSSSLCLSPSWLTAWSNLPWILLFLLLMRQTRKNTSSTRKSS